jgi:hypothetical protein
LKGLQKDEMQRFKKMMMAFIFFCNTKSSAEWFRTFCESFERQFDAPELFLIQKIYYTII